MFFCFYDRFISSHMIAYEARRGFSTKEHITDSINCEYLHSNNLFFRALLSKSSIEFTII